MQVIGKGRFPVRPGFKDLTVYKPDDFVDVASACRWCETRSKSRDLVRLLQRNVGVGDNGCQRRYQGNLDV